MFLNVNASEKSEFPIVNLNDCERSLSLRQIMNRKGNKVIGMVAIVRNA